MKRLIIVICASGIVSAGLLPQARADETVKSREFERLKTLVGTWKGLSDLGQGPVEMTVQYRMVAGGSVLEERIMAGTPQEMVTMFFEKGGELALTHYCMLGNQPGMLLKSSDAKSMVFDFDKNCGVNPKETHMHSMKLTFNDADTLTMSCKLFVDGKEEGEHPTTLKRVTNLN